MQVMILAAGRGTRLGPLGEQRPKPLVPICGYPAITFNLALCARAGFRRVVINLHHHGDQIREHLGDGSRFGVEISYSVEDALLGTGGGLAKARALFAAGPVLVINGKIVADVNLETVASAHAAAAPGTLATMVVRAGDPAFASVAIDERGQVVGLRGQRGPRTVTGPVTDTMFTGVHVVTPALLDRLPPAGESDVIAAAYQPALAEGARVQAVVMNGYFAEHSTPERYLAGNLALLRDPALVPTPPGPLVGIAEGATVDPAAVLRPPVRVAEGAIIEPGARIGPDVVVGPGARVRTGARLERVVVWDGAVAAGDVRDAVVTGEGVVPSSIVDR